MQSSENTVDTESFVLEIVVTTQCDGVDIEATKKCHLFSIPKGCINLTLDGISLITIFDKINLNK